MLQNREQVLTKRRFSVAVLASAGILQGSAQGVDYRDVGVVVNSNSVASMQIGTYFMAARNIPANRLIVIEADTTVNIDPIAFSPIREQIEAHIELHQLTDSLNYLVTTKGVPLRLDNGTCDTQNQFSRCSSFDTELSLILGPYANSIAAQGSIVNPFAGSLIKQQRATSGIYLVTRLTAPTVDDVIELIDRSGPSLSVDTSNVLLVGDVNNTDTIPGVQEVLNSMMTSTISPFTAAGWNTALDLTDIRLDDLENVLVYVGMNSPDIDSHPTMNWANGAIAVEWHFSTALDQDLSGETIGEQRIAKHIEAGATAALGSVGRVYASPWGYTFNLLDRYLDTTYQFNVAESIYAFIPFLSWTYQVVGDPKTSVAFVSPTAINDFDKGDSMFAYPNPSDGLVTLSAGEAFRVERITDMLGRPVTFTSRTASGTITLDLSGQAPGVYLFHCVSHSGARIHARVLVQR